MWAPQVVISMSNSRSTNLYLVLASMAEVVKEMLEGFHKIRTGECTSLMLIHSTNLTLKENRVA
jgi:hypothetical protein